ncbi:MAG: 50S ribosomal protein L10 [Acidimicrobiia bacterium]|nr:50S ribosomal protein L10 [Acidimicrobiia bacterium]
MARPEKVQAVAEIKERIEESDAVFAAEYAGLSVKQQQSLRRGLRGSDAEFKVVKMTLAKRAADELELAEFDQFLVGPTGLTFAADAVSAAKVLDDFARENDGLVIKGGLLGGDVLSAERVGQLAKIEPREVLLAKFAGGLKAPMYKLAGMLAALPRYAAYAIGQLLDKRESEAPAPEPEAAAEATDDASDSAAEAPEADAAEAESSETSKAEAPAAETEADAEEAAAEEADESATADEPTEDQTTDTTDDDEPAAAAEEE